MSMVCRLMFMTLVWRYDDLCCVINGHFDNSTYQNGDTITLDINCSGQLYYWSQIINYCARGRELEEMNIIEFFVNTYEEDISSRRFEDLDEMGPMSRGPNETSDYMVRFRMGPRSNQRIRYLPSHPKFEMVQRVLRRTGHNNLPNFIGGRFPTGDDDDTRDVYHASMLMLLKPWRNIIRDLKGVNQTWEESFLSFVNGPMNENKRIHDILSSIRYLHDCKVSCDVDQAGQDQNGGLEIVDDIEEGSMTDHQEQFQTDFADDGLHEGNVSQATRRKALHARLAIEIAKAARIFNEDDSQWSIDGMSAIRNPSIRDVTQLVEWKRQLEVDIAN